MDFDPEKIQTISSNLVGNALKFTPPGGDVYIKIQQNKTDQSRCCIRVADTGAGISEDHLPYIFDRFYQVDDAVTRQGEGTGIGLATVQRILKRHNGRIWAEAEPGKGATFYFTLGNVDTSE